MLCAEGRKTAVGRNGSYILTRMVEAENHGLHWYALKVFYNKVFAVEEELTADGTECYVRWKKPWWSEEGSAARCAVP